MKEMIYTPYAPEYDMTFIVRDTFDENGNLKTTEVIGFYYGDPDETATAEFIGKLKSKCKGGNSMTDPKTIKEICEEYGLKQIELSRRFNIPRRTVQDWYSEKRTPPDYVVGMIDELLQKEKEPRN